jgi:hypothetical protein
MPKPFRLATRNAYPWWFAGSAALAGAGFYLLPTDRQTPELLLSLLGGAAAFFHFLYSQHNANTERFVSLFTEFNTRYDKLNDHLNRITQLSTGSIVAPHDLQHLYDYFNLCAEEYLYFKSGYIDAEVWLSWSRGMAYFAGNSEVRRIWERELHQGSYYGFKLSLLPNAV